MAYAATEYRIQVRGALLDGAESFYNTWTVLDEGATSDIDDVFAALHDMYAAFAAQEMSSHTTVLGATARQLSTGLLSEATWATITGDDLANPLPSQMAVRISLSAGAGVRGGPFIPGWSINSGDGDGKYQHAAALATAVGDFTNDLNTAGWQLRLDQPTLEQTAQVTSGRVGARFDVIRKRANDVAETYSPITIIP